MVTRSDLTEQQRLSKLRSVDQASRAILVRLSHSADGKAALRAYSQLSEGLQATLIKPDAAEVGVATQALTAMIIGDDAVRAQVKALQNGDGSERRLFKRFAYNTPEARALLLPPKNVEL